MRRLTTFVLSTFFVLIFLPQLWAQGVRKPRFDTGLNLSAEAAAERWAQFANGRLAGDYCMAFVLEHRPRRAEETRYTGYMIGGERPDGTYTRIHIRRADAPAESADFIFRNSAGSSAVWKFDGKKFAVLPEALWRNPMLSGLVYSPFELLMPFKFWNVQYEGSGRAGQPVHFYELSSPKFAGVSVRVALTRDFNAPAQVSVSDGASSKTARLSSVKKIDGVWVMREISVKDEASRDSDLLRFTAAKFGLKWGMAPFLPDSPADLEIPSLDRL